MRKTIHKWFWAWDFDKEENWLNQMAAIGLNLVAVGWCAYTFEEGEPGEYTVRPELLDNVPIHAESGRYIKFVEDTGAEYLGAILRWAYFRKKRASGAFDLYSDTASRIKHLDRILTLIGVLALMDIAVGINNIVLYWSFGKTMANLVGGILVLGLGLLLGWGFLRVYAKKRRLKKEKQLYE